MNAFAQLTPLIDAIIARIHDGVILTDNLGTVLYANLAACGLLGIPRVQNVQQINESTGMDLPQPCPPTGAHEGRPLSGRPLLTQDRRICQRIETNGVTRFVNIDMQTLALASDAPPMQLMFLTEVAGRQQTDAGQDMRIKRNLITEDPHMLEIRDAVAQIAPTRASVLLQGESGTGKTLLARMIHEHSTNAKAPLVELNCAAIPENLLESELFGHVKGAFTGAVSDRPGRFQAANGGTLFLDEVSEIPLHLQPKLLKALEERRFQMVGSDRNIEVNVRIIAASNKNLRELVEAGQFRADLYYRLAVVPVTVPALRDRPCDIPLLVRHMHERLIRHGYPSSLEFDSEAMGMLLDYPWPGNVRELANAVEHGAIFSRGGVITPKCLPADIQGYCAEHHAASPQQSAHCEIREALDAANGNRAQAARLLGIDRTTLWRRMHRIGLS